MISKWIKSTSNVLLEKDGEIIERTPFAFSSTIKKLNNIKKKIIMDGDRFNEIKFKNNSIVISYIDKDFNKIIELHMNGYEKHARVRKNIFKLAKDRGHKISSPYINQKEKIKINFNCGHGDTLTTYDVYRKMKEDKCPVCRNRTIVKGINDIATTNPELVKYFIDVKDAYKYGKESSEKLKFKCHKCGSIKEYKIKVLSHFGFVCNLCSNKISYPERFMMCLLNELKETNDIHFIKEISPSWSRFPSFHDKNKFSRGIYDFLIESPIKMIIEMDGGLGHGNKKVFEKALDMDETLYIDKQKDRIAKENGYPVIRIKCNYINNKVLQHKHIVNKIITSDLANIFDITNIDWNKVEMHAQENLIEKICEYYNKNKNKGTGDIAKHFNIGIAGIRNYLKIGHSFGLCEYDPKLEMIKSGKRQGEKNKKYIFCYNTSEIYKGIYNTQKQSKEMFGVNVCNISSACRGEREHSNGFTFKYLEDLTEDEYIKYRIEEKLKYFKEVNKDSILRM